MPSKLTLKYWRSNRAKRHEDTPLSRKKKRYNPMNPQFFYEFQNSHLSSASGVSQISWFTVAVKWNRNPNWWCSYNQEFWLKVSESKNDTFLQLSLNKHHLVQFVRNGTKEAHNPYENVGHVKRMRTLNVQYNHHVTTSLPQPQMCAHKDRIPQIYNTTNADQKNSQIKKSMMMMMLHS